MTRLQSDLPRVALHDGGPTPVRELADGLWLKDDGAFGSGGWGGNKVRKLEWLLGEARTAGRRRIMTFGGRATNWGLALARHARPLGIETVLALVDQPMDAHAQAQFARIRESGATVHLTRTKARTIAAAPYLWLRHGRPWVLPAGGSTPLGAVGYVEAGLEIGEQVRAGALPEPDRVVTAVGTGGTLAGLVVGLQAAGLRSRPYGAVVNDKLRLDHRRIARLARECARVAGVGEVDADRFDLTRAFLGAGYGHALPGGDPAFDPVYTAKAIAAARALEGTVLFIQTDGPR